MSFLFFMCGLVLSSLVRLWVSSRKSGTFWLFSYSRRRAARM